MNFTPAQYESYLARHAQAARNNEPTPSSSDVVVESALHYQIIDYCKSKGWIYLHGSMAHKAMRTLGEPDFTILANGGKVYFIECKTRTGKLSIDQLALKMMAEKLGHSIATVRSMSDFLEIVK